MSMGMAQAVACLRRRIHRGALPLTAALVLFVQFWGSSWGSSWGPSWVSPASAAGGAGGAGLSGTEPGGAGGTGFVGNAGSNGGDGGSAGGGGGGGGAGGGNGGTGGGAGGSGGAGGTAGSPNGQAGQSSGARGGDGGGGGGYNGNGAGAAAITNTSPLTGGSGGAGGADAGDSGAGGGGAGGYGAIVTGAGASSNTSTITGGAGGAGGAISSGAGNAGGNGGDGGVGAQFTAAGATFTNSGAVTGGNGGAGGIAIGGATSGTAGAGGAGIVGAGLTIINSGTIAGGFANGGSGAQAAAIIFTGGSNSVGNSGTISGGINVQGGSFAPALSSSAIGTPLAFGGPITFAPGTQYLIRVSPSASDNLTTSGTATLTGASVNAQFASGSYLARQYTILTATGGLGGTTFASLTNTNLPAGFVDSLSYSGDSVLLNLTAGALSNGGLNQNQQAVANGLNNFFNSGGALPPNFVNVFGLTGGSLGNALTQLDGEVATGAERSAFQLMTEFLGLMLDPFVDGRLGGLGGSGLGGGTAIGFAPEQEANLPPDIALAYASILTKAPPRPVFDQRWTAWGSAYGGANATTGNSTVGSSNVTSDTYGFAAGMDYHFSPDTIFGFALGGGGLNWGLANGLGAGRSDVFQTGVYGITRSGPAYLGAAFAVANHWMTTNRVALGDQLTANFDGQSYGGRVEAGYRFAMTPIRTALIGITPYAALQAQEFHTPSYSESDQTGGGFGLSYNAMNGTDTRTELGSRFDDPTVVAGMPLVLRGRVAWAHDFVSNPSIGAVFQSLPGSNFTVNGAPIAQNSALASAGAELFLTPRLTLLAKFDGEFADGSQTYAGSGTLRYSW